MLFFFLQKQQEHTLKKGQCLIHDIGKLGIHVQKNEIMLLLLTLYKHWF